MYLCVGGWHLLDAGDLSHTLSSASLRGLDHDGEAHTLAGGDTLLDRLDVGLVIDLLRDAALLLVIHFQVASVPANAGHASTGLETE